jgi:ribosomal protein S6
MNIYHMINNKNDRYQLIDLHTKHKMISILKRQLAIEARIMHYHHIIQQEAYAKYYQQI